MEQVANAKKKANQPDLPRLPAVAGDNDPNMAAFVTNPGWFGLDQDTNYDATSAKSHTKASNKSHENAKTQRAESPGAEVSQSAIDTQLPLPEQLGKNAIAITN